MSVISDSLAKLEAIAEDVHPGASAAIKAEVATIKAEINKVGDEVKSDVDKVEGAVNADPS